MVLRRFAKLQGFEQVAEAAAVWDVDFRLLGAGSGSGVIETIATDRALVQRHRFGWKLHQRGAAPGNFRTFGFGASRRQEFPWNGHNVEGDWLLSFPEDGGFESVSSESFHAYTLSFGKDLIERTAEVLGLLPTGDRQSAADVTQVSPDSARRIRNSLQDIVRAARQIRGHAAGDCRGLTQAIESDLLSQILCAITEGRSTGRPRARLRALALQRSAALIEEAAARPVTVRELCEVSGVSWRTLDYAFKERFGLTPKAYMRTHRLNAAHAELRGMAMEDGTIAEVAWRWGFWHQSRFAADYRRLFGELPSETLRRRAG